MCRFKEEAEGAIVDLREHVAAAHQERHALERQAKDQVSLLACIHCALCLSVFTFDIGTLLLLGVLSFNLYVRLALWASPY